MIALCTFTLRTFTQINVILYWWWVWWVVFK